MFITSPNQLTEENETERSQHIVGDHINDHVSIVYSRHVNRKIF